MLASIYHVGFVAERLDAQGTEADRHAAVAPVACLRAARTGRRRRPSLGYLPEGSSKCRVGTPPATWLLNTTGCETERFYTQKVVGTSSRERIIQGNLGHVLSVSIVSCVCGVLGTSSENVIEFRNSLATILGIEFKEIPQSRDLQKLLWKSTRYSFVG